MGIFDIFRPKWKHSNPKSRLEAVEELTDQSVLTRLVRTDLDIEVRKAAVGKVTDQPILADISKTANDEDVRKVAVERITNQWILADLAKMADDEKIRRIAVKKINKKATLVDLAKTAGDKDVREEARAILDKIIRAEEKAKRKAEDKAKHKTLESARALPNEETVCNVEKIDPDAILATALKSGSHKPFEDAYDAISDNMLANYLQKGDAISSTCSECRKQILMLATKDAAKLLLLIMSSSPSTMRKLAWYCPGCRAIFCSDCLGYGSNTTVPLHQSLIHQSGGCWKEVVLAYKGISG